MKGTPSVMTADTLSGWTAAAKYAGIAPKSFPTRKAWYQKIQVVGVHIMIKFLKFFLGNSMELICSQN